MSFDYLNKGKSVGYLIVSILTLVSSLVVFTILLYQRQASRIVNASSYSSEQVVVKVNEERIKYGLKPLFTNSELNSAAQMKVDDMINKSYFSHVSPVDGVKWSDFIKNSGYIYLEAGENLATGYETVDDMVLAWMKSPTHKENILSSGYHETGVAYSSYKDDGVQVIVVAQVFGRQVNGESDIISVYY